jgi:hypothetical protein
LRASEEAETVQENIQDWLVLDEGEPRFQLLTDEEIAVVKFLCLFLSELCHNSGRYPSSCLLFKTAFQRLNSVSVFRRNLLRWAQNIKN